MNFNPFWETVIDSFLGRFFFTHHHQLRKFVRNIVGHIKTSDEWVLDLGAGHCQYKPLFKDNCIYHACDMEKSVGDIDFLCWATEIPCKEDQYDKVICIQVLEHVTKPPEVFGEVFRILKKGGTLFLSTNMATELHCEPYDYFRFTKYGLKFLAEEAGFDVISICPQGGRGTLIASESFRLLTGSSLPARWKHAMFIVMSIPLFFIMVFFNLMEVLIRDDSHTSNYACIFRKPVAGDPVLPEQASFLRKKETLLPEK